MTLTFTSSLTGFNPYRVFKFVATLRSINYAANHNVFQSLSGFQVRCNILAGLNSVGGSKVSIPIGFSSSLQRIDMACSSLHLIDVSIPIGFSSSLQQLPEFVLPDLAVVFQSLSGFQVRCNVELGLSPDAFLSLFQSLSGFQVRCNLIFSRFHSASQPMFQSLSGFQVRCNRLDYRADKFGTQKFQSLSGFQVRCNAGSGLDRGSPERHVSIPIGFSSSLQRIGLHVPPLSCRIVSIPIGFSSSLQPIFCHTDRHFHAVLFQSLSGFQVRCNRIVGVGSVTVKD